MISIAVLRTMGSWHTPSSLTRASLYAVVLQYDVTVCIRFFYTFIELADGFDTGVMWF